MSIRKIAVIGSGVMGSGIAAQVANAGFPVVLLDIKLEGRDLAAEAVQKMLKTDPAPFMRKSNAKLITTGNLDDNLDLLKDCDWIIEVVLEDLKVKHATYEKLNRYVKKGSIISSNTSTIPLHNLVEGQGADFEKDFLITHFFNPPRYMRLLELVVGKNTRADAVKEVRAFCDVNLGKGVVKCNDTPGFIANRLGVFWLTAGVNEAIKQNISIELADAVMSKPVGIPKTGVFGLIDLVGIDLMPKLSDSLLSTLPKDDAYRTLFIDHKFVHGMIAAGYTGRKGKGGFYRLNPDGKSKEKQALAINAASFDESQYKKAEKVSGYPSIEGRGGLKAVVTSPDEAGKYAWEVLKQTLHYAASLVGEIAETVYDIDEGMKLGYNWKQGPFEMIDALGPEWFASELGKAGMDVPKILKDVGANTFYKVENGALQYFGTDKKYHKVVRPEGVLLLSDLKRAGKPVVKNGSASVWDIGDGVLCFEHTSKMNTFDDGTFEMLNKAKTLIEQGGEYKALVIYNEASNFSAGANLGLALFMVNIAMWPQVEQFIATGQKMFLDLKYANFPVVAAPSGMALGGGCEILLTADHIQAHAETYCGLVEVGVGVIPGWGGCKELLLRFQEREKAQFTADLEKVDKKNLWMSPNTTPMGAVRKAFEVIGTAMVAKSAFEAQEIGYFRESDGVTMNRDRLLFDAKKRALELAKDYTPPVKRDDIRLPGATGKLALEMAVKDLQKSGKATPYDGVVCGHLATVLSGGNHDYTEKLTEEDILKLELSQFSELLHNEGTMARIEHMLSTGKPLRN
ncbi:MAG: 3-hydroxyacyl-CoA dehydrogenase NAD-binding domain-containing protein [Alphaproteobacteria bacterium]|nr:3-hydroxyacyl-CoA dehydrogenase NAD-binding domain-containing protein [Alphaproteobacteria bacterium]